MPLFGDAGRPLHARRPWREHLDLGRVGCAVRRRCRSTTTCRIAARISASSTASICRAMRWPQRRVGRAARRWRSRRRRCWHCLQALAVRTEALLDEGRSLSAEIRDIRLGVEVSVIQAYRRQDRAHAEGARSPARARASQQVRAARLTASPASTGEVGRRAVGRTAPSPKTGGLRMTLEAAVAQRQLRLDRIRQLVLRRDAHPAARPARSDVPDLQLLPPGRRHRRFRRAARRAARRASGSGATTSTRSIRAIRRRG